jgi:hypothetical protein
MRPTPDCHESAFLHYVSSVIVPKPWRFAKRCEAAMTCADWRRDPPSRLVAAPAGVRFVAARAPANGTAVAICNSVHHPDRIA